MRKGRWFERWKLLPKNVPSRVKVARIIADALGEVKGLAVSEPEEFIGPLGGEGVQVNVIMPSDSKDRDMAYVTINIYGK